MRWDEVRGGWDESRSRCVCRSQKEQCALLLQGSSPHGPKSAHHSQMCFILLPIQLLLWLTMIICSTKSGAKTKSAVVDLYDLIHYV